MDLSEKELYERIKAACSRAAADNALVRDFFAELFDNNYIGEAKGVAVEYGGPDVDLSEYENIQRMLGEIVAYADARMSETPNV